MKVLLLAFCTADRSFTDPGAAPPNVFSMMHPG